VSALMRTERDKKQRVVGEDASRSRWKLWTINHIICQRCSWSCSRRPVGDATKKTKLYMPWPCVLRGPLRTGRGDGWAEVVAVALRARFAQRSGCRKSRGLASRFFSATSAVSVV